jgi:NAD(P)-dependent dehydrogenase (short-subunit alcohol dehydrogenase family)
MNSDTKGNVLITGAAQRIGRAIATALAEDGWTIGIHYFRSSEAADGLCAELTDKGARAYTLGADLGDDSVTDGLIERASVAGPVTCLINNASVFERDAVETVNRTSWDTHMAVNLWAPLCLSQAFAGTLPDGVPGNIVNIVDQRVENIPPDFLSYTVSKAGLWTLTQSLALSLAPRIRVNAIGPGPVLPSPRQSREQFEEQASRMPLGHGAPVTEIADGVRYILSATSMTGQLISLDGGQHLGWDFPDPDAPPVHE